MPTNLLFSAPRSPFQMSTVVNPEAVHRHANSIRMAVAYMTHGGLKEFVNQVEPYISFERVSTEWVVGIHNGITEPRALRAIRKLPNSRLRLFAPTRKIERKSLTAAPRMHAKLLAVGRNDGSSWRAFLMGSANATAAVLSPHAINFEAGISFYEAAIEGSELNHFEQWWRAIGRYCVAGSEGEIGKYEKLRVKFLRQPVKPVDVLDIDPPDPEDVRNATVFWLDSGDMSGGTDDRWRYQSDINDYMAHYFHAHPRRTDFQLVMSNGDQQRGSVTRRREHHFVPLWRLSLPLPRKYGPYRNHILRFERIGNGRFRLTIFEIGSRPAEALRRRANRDGYLGRTGTATSLDGREWGIFV